MSTDGAKEALLIVHPEFPWTGQGDGAAGFDDHLLPTLRRLAGAASSGRYEVAVVRFYDDLGARTKPEARDLLARIYAHARHVVPEASAVSPQVAAAWLRNRGFTQPGRAGGFWRGHCVRDVARLSGHRVSDRLSASR